MLLHYCVGDPWTAPFICTPLSQRGILACNADTYMFSFIVEDLHRLPVLFLDIRDES
jgi:hypothetical protein